MRAASPTAPASLRVHPSRPLDRSGPLALDTVGECGTQCEDFCKAGSVVCMGSDNPYSDDSDLTYSACLTACASFPTTGSIGDSIGDTIQCRAYYIQVTSSFPP